MNGKIVVLILFSIFAISFSSSFASAHFVCGEVKNSDYNVSSSWMNVIIFYPSNPSLYTNCQVSPQDSKYCCDVEAIPGKTWTIGSVVSAEIYSPETGYVAGPVSVITTGNGYDIFPIMQIEKVISVYSPSENLILSNDSLVLLNASFISPYNFAKIYNGSSFADLCNNCWGFSGNLSAFQGMNEWNISASDGSRSFYQTINFAMLSDVNFSKTIQCNGCRSNSVPQAREFNLTLYLNLSGNVTELLLEEYVPSDFSVINTDGNLTNDNTYNVIKWTVSGDHVEKNITLKSPGLFWPKEYSLETDFGGIKISQDNVTISRFFRFFPSHKNPHFKSAYFIYPVISPTSPYLINGRDNLLKLAVFPNGVITNVGFDVTTYVPEENLRGAIAYYLIQSNTNVSDIHKIYVEFKVHIDSSINTSQIYLYDYTNKWVQQNITLFGQDSNNYYFKGYVNGTSFAIVDSNTKGFFKSLSSFIRKLSGKND